MLFRVLVHLLESLSHYSIWSLHRPFTTYYTNTILTLGTEADLELDLDLSRWAVRKEWSLNVVKRNRSETQVAEEIYSSLFIRQRRQFLIQTFKGTRLRDSRRNNWRRRWVKVIIEGETPTQHQRAVACYHACSQDVGHRRLPIFS